MAGKYSLALDEENIQRLKATAVSECVLNLAVDLLVGNVDDDHIQRVSGESGLDFATCVATARAAGALLWEFTRSGTDNPATVAAILLQLGLEKNACDIFAGVYESNRRVLASLKNSMTISFMQYQNFSWRLDVEMRLDLENSISSSCLSQSINIQSDYANLKRLQIELQSAVDETSSVHAQRISRYIT